MSCSTSVVMYVSAQCRRETGPGCWATSDITPQGVRSHLISRSGPTQLESNTLSPAPTIPEQLRNGCSKVSQFRGGKDHRTFSCNFLSVNHEVFPKGSVRYKPLMADSTLSNSRNIRTASSSGTSAICGKERARFVSLNPRQRSDQNSTAAHLEDDAFNHFAVFLALFFGLALQVLVHLSSAHHVLKFQHKTPLTESSFVISESSGMTDVPSGGPLWWGF